MATGMPEVGSRISLISKADIRYEGKLFTIDSNECTIALCNVRSYGTEDRETNFPIPAQSQVYDYILFRGTDIKDIKVLSTTIPHDPAIVKLSVPPTINAGQFGFGPSGVGSMPVSNLLPSVSQMPPPLPQSNFHQTQSTNNNQMHAPSMYGTSHYSTFPSNFQNSLAHSRLSMNSRPPTVGHGQKGTEFAENRSRSSAPEAEEQRNESNDKNTDQTVRDNSKDHPESTERNISPIPHDKFRFNRQQERGTSNNRGQRLQNNRQNYNRWQPQPQSQFQSQPGYYNERSNRYRERPGYENNYNAPRQFQTATRGGGNWNTGMQKTRGYANRNMMGTQNYRQMNNIGQFPRNRNSRTLDEYDFEEANSQFEELRSKLAKTKLDDTPAAPVANDSDKKDDSGNETGLGDGEHDEEDKVFYDKKKSFFDHISCEAIEKSKGHMRRPDWKLEHKLNSETFGLSAFRRSTPSYREYVSYHYQARGGGQSYRSYNSGNYYHNRYNNQVRRQPSAITRVDSTQTDEKEN